MHAAVRDPKNKAKVKHLVAMDKALPGTLKLFKADLLDEGSYEEAMKGCDVVFHTASPFISKFTDPQRDLVDPAVNGTRNVLNSVNKVNSVKRVVVTSSTAAINGDLDELERVPGGTMTEEMWNVSSQLDYKSYAFSKVQAEKAAWEIANAQKRWKLITINPAMVVGPGASEALTSDSFNTIKMIGNGSMKNAAPPREIGFVDVQDVAEAHLRAGFIPDAQGRYIVCDRTYNFLELGKILRAALGDAYPFPTRQWPKWLLWLVGPMISKSFNREMVSKNMGRPWRADNSKSKRELGMEYRPASAAVVKMFQQMVDRGEIKPS